MLGRLVHKADFERLLATRSRARSAHFALHHVQGGPLVVKKPAKSDAAQELSTGHAPSHPQPVDDLPEGHWIGFVVPKRHARRAVTRNLLRRQMRATFERHVANLPGGLWLLRLRVGFSVTDFVSARSATLSLAARSELDQLLAKAA